MAAPCESMDERICEIEVSVVTGFENVAKGEMAEVLGAKVSVGRGNASFCIPVKDVRKVLQLSSIDNATVVLKRYHDFKFQDTVDGCMQQFSALIPELDWELGLAVWGKVFTFDHPVSHLAKSQQNSDRETSGAAGDAQKHSSECPTVIQSNVQGETTTETPGSGCEKDKAQGSADNDEGAPEGNAESAKGDLKPARNAMMPGFRATCYRSGGKHVFQSPQAACDFGGALQDYFGWNVDLSNHDIEVILTVSSNHVYVSLGLTRGSLHKRNITQFGPTTLKPTIAYNMLRLCRIQPGEVVCDPMCGGGTIPLEAAINWPQAYHLCGDNHNLAPPRTLANLQGVCNKRAKKGREGISVDVLRWDATNLPLADNSVDVLITDMPFGKRSGSKFSNWQLYPNILRDFARVCRLHTGRLCLLTQDKKCLISTLRPLAGLWLNGPMISINIGGLAAGVFLLHRTGRKYLPRAPPGGSTGDQGGTAAAAATAADEEPMEK